MFDLNLSQYGKSPCLITNDTMISYIELENLCEKIQNSIPENKQLILIKADRNIETIVGYISFLKANHAFILIDSELDNILINNIIDIYKPNFIWESAKNNEKYLISYGDYGLRQNNHEVLKLNPELAMLLSTSGTTGSPKMVKLSKKNLYSNCKSIVKYLNIDSKHRAISNLPFYYSYGISIINTHLEKGASIFITKESILSKEFWNIFNQYKITTLSGVPYTYEILRKIGFMKMDLPSLKFMTQAGGKLNHKLAIEYANWSQKKLIDFYIMYGQTEATARISYLKPKEIVKKENSIGVSIPNGELMIKDLNTDTYINNDNVEGELIYKGENVMLGYANELTDLSKYDEQKGILHTGDLAKKDEDGYFYITGRIKRFIKIHGNRTNLDEIEQYLKSLYYNALCTGIDNKLLIATTDEDKIEEIKEMLIKKYSFHHSVIKVKYIKEYPVANTGKIKYQDLLEGFK